jgi:hypothetical protein
MVLAGSSGPVMTAALGVELVVTPAIYLWQQRLARLAPMDASAAAR